MFVIIECDPNDRGADAIIGVYGVVATEESAQMLLADMRDDDPNTGNGWTYMEVN
jgi:hypothetical protein